MKLLLFSDLHSDMNAAHDLVERSKDVDVVIGAGDFSNNRHGLARSIQALSRIDKPTILVPGNNESFEELQQACRGWSSVRVLHGSGVAIKGVEFFGIGGGVPVTPFGSWSFDLTEDEAAKLLKSCPENCVLVS